jgi:hypothetical protein
MKGVKAQAAEFLRVYAGPHSNFYESISKITCERESDASSMSEIVEAFAEYMEAGLHQGLSPERKAQIDVVSDVLLQASTLLEDPKVHPGAPAMLIGAALEEFLRTWSEAQELSLGNRKPGIEAYTSVLKESELITKQDHKDITSWAGLRNHAAHGEWAEVTDKARITLMLEGVNLFMRKYS